MSVAPDSGWEVKQAEHFNKYVTQYEAHVLGECNHRYRDRFMHGPMLEGINLSGLHVLEAMCGSGASTDYLVSRGARVTGLDISSELIASFKKRWPQCDAKCGSIFETGFDSNSFDCVVVVGGLHHLHPKVDEAVDEIYRVLKPGGCFCFMEPHAGSLPNLVRRLWYKVDPLFEKNEAAVDIEALKSKNASRFVFNKTKYMGTVGFLLVYNSLIFRMPLWLKRLYSPLLMGFERITNPFMFQRVTCYAVGQWKKKG